MGRKILNDKIKLKKNQNQNDKKAKRRKYYLSMLDKKKNFKPPICKYFTYGSCKIDGCIYSHDVTPDQMKKFDEMCKYYAVGECVKRDMCCYMHETFPCIFFHNKLGNKCNKGDKCLFSHEPLSEEKALILENHLKNQSIRGQVIEERISENNVPIQSNFGKSTFGKSIFRESVPSFENMTKDVDSEHLTSENEIEDENIKIIENNAPLTVPIQSNFGQSTLNSKDLISSFNSDNFGKSIFRESVPSFENMTKDVDSEHLTSENEIEDQNLKITEDNDKIIIGHVIEHPMKLSDNSMTNRNDAPKFTKVIYDSDTDSQLEICENHLSINITNLDESEKNSEKITSDRQKSDILENLAFNFDNVPKFTKIEFSDSDWEDNNSLQPPLQEAIFTGDRKPCENWINNKLLKENNEKFGTDNTIESDIAINQGNCVDFIDEMQQKSNKQRKDEIEVIENKIQYNQIDELSTQNSLLSEKRPRENKTCRKQRVINKKKNKNLSKIPNNNRKTSPKFEEILLDCETKNSNQESQIMDCSNDDDDLFSGFSTHHFTVTKSSMELLGFDSQHCIDLENVINDHIIIESNGKENKFLRINEDCQNVGIVQSQSSSEISVLNNSVDADTNINESPFINSTGVEMEKCIQTTESKNSEITNNFDKDNIGNEEIGENNEDSICLYDKCIWQPPQLILSPRLEYRKMNINCYNLRHKFDDPRIRNHPKALKQSVSEWLNS